MNLNHVIFDVGITTKRKSGLFRILQNLGTNTFAGDNSIVHETYTVTTDSSGTSNVSCAKSDLVVDGITNIIRKVVVVEYYQWITFVHEHMMNKIDISRIDQKRVLQR